MPLQLSMTDPLIHVHIVLGQAVQSVSGSSTCMSCVHSLREAKLLQPRHCLPSDLPHTELQTNPDQRMTAYICYY